MKSDGHYRHPMLVNAQKIKESRSMMSQLEFFMRHFSTVIRQETGHTAAWWIHRQVVSEAKNLRTMRPDLNIQAVADQLGFADTFSRYFHRETGISPTEFREGNTMCPKP